MEKERPCTFLIHNETVDIPVNQLKQDLESGDIQSKIGALKKVILLMLNGQSMPQLLMTIIRFAMPSKDKTIKKLLLLFWEVCEKTGPDGKLLHEMILVWYDEPPLREPFERKISRTVFFFFFYNFWSIVQSHSSKYSRIPPPK